MYAANWIEAFVEIYKIETAVPLIFFCLLALLKIRKMDRDLLRARFFLNNVIMHRTWIFNLDWHDLSCAQCFGQLCRIFWVDTLL